MFIKASLTRNPIQHIVSPVLASQLMCSGSVASMSDTGDSWYVALLGLAESFRQANNIKECVRFVSIILVNMDFTLLCLSDV